MNFELGEAEATHDPGVAGESSRREHERRKSKRERHVREKHPKLGGLLLALGEQPTNELSWALGAASQEQVGEVLSGSCNDTVQILHDRRWPTGRPNIDHLAIAPSGVWLIDVKAHRGMVEVDQPLHAKSQLLIRGRDQTGLVEGLHRQVKSLREVMEEIDPNVEIHGCLCFTDASLPLLRTLMIAGYPLLHPRALAKRLNQPGVLSRERVELLTIQLAAILPRA